jgi:hypothetical protein
MKERKRESLCPTFVLLSRLMGVDGRDLIRQYRTGFSFIHSFIYLSY